MASSSPPWEPRLRPPQEMAKRIPASGWPLARMPVVAEDCRPVTKAGPRADHRYMIGSVASVCDWLAPLPGAQFDRCPRPHGGPSMKRILLAVGVVLTAVPLSPRAQTAVTDTWKAPRTPDGHPDFQGLWTTQTFTPLQRPARYAGREYQ